jgi:hypothetical protein
MAKRVKQAEKLIKATYKPPKSQVDIIRRLTQKANRRITQAFKIYEETGKYRIPGAITEGRITTREDWASEKYPLSRSVVFESEKAFQKHLAWLQRFDLPEARGGLPTMTEYQNIQGNKILLAMQTALGGATPYDMPPEIMEHMYKAIMNMSAPEQTDFWKAFQKRGQKLLDKFSSKAAMEQALNEFFGKEEIRPLLIKSIIEAKGIKSVTGQRMEFDKIKNYNNKALVNYLKKSR